MTGNHGNTTNLAKHVQVSQRWSKEEGRHGGAAARGDKGALNKSLSPLAPANSVQVQAPCAAIGGSYLCG